MYTVLITNSFKTPSSPPIPLLPPLFRPKHSLISPPLLWHPTLTPFLPVTNKTTCTLLNLPYYCVSYHPSLINSNHNPVPPTLPHSTWSQSPQKHALAFTNPWLNLRKVWNCVLVNSLVFLSEHDLGRQSLKERGKRRHSIVRKAQGLIAMTEVHVQLKKTFLC